MPNLYVQVKDADGGSASYSIEEFCAANSDSPELVAQVRSMNVGESYHEGGGAAPWFEVTIVEAQPKAAPISDGGPAFARPSTHGDIGSEGMSLRDYLAAAALSALHSQVADCFTASLARGLNMREAESAEWSQKRIDEIAETVYAIADAILVRREGRS